MTYQAKKIDTGTITLADGTVYSWDSANEDEYLDLLSFSHLVEMAAYGPSVVSVREVDGGPTEAEAEAILCAAEYLSTLNIVQEMYHSSLDRIIAAVTSEIDNSRAILDTEINVATASDDAQG